MWRIRASRLAPEGREESLSDPPSRSATTRSDPRSTRASARRDRRRARARMRLGAAALAGGPLRVAARRQSGARRGRVCETCGGDVDTHPAVPGGARRPEGGGGAPGRRRAKKRKATHDRGVHPTGDFFCHARPVARRSAVASTLPVRSQPNRGVCFGDKVETQAQGGNPACLFSFEWSWEVN